MREAGEDPADVRDDIRIVEVGAIELTPHELLEQASKRMVVVNHHSHTLVLTRRQCSTRYNDFTNKEVCS